MPKFKYQFRREYTITEGFDRVIEAPSRAEADAAATNLAGEFNMDCPDDCSEDEHGHSEAGGFDAEYEADMPAGKPDYVVQADGQMLPVEE